MSQKIKTERLRLPYYNLSDNVFYMKDAAEQLEDKTLIELANDLQRVQDRIHKHLERKYLWD